MDSLNILIVGVGGQGTLLTSVLLGKLGMEAGYDVKLSEVHGMAQRGGSVVTHVRLSKTGVSAPVISEGGADIILAFEQLEAYRWASYLKKGGKIYVNLQEIDPMPVVLGTQAYPSDISGFFNAKEIDASFINAEAMALGLHNPRVVNTLLLGAAAKVMPFSKDEWLRQIETTIKKEFVDINKQAFLQGYDLKQ